MLSLGRAIEERKRRDSLSAALYLSLLQLTSAYRARNCLYFFFCLYFNLEMKTFLVDKTLKNQKFNVSRIFYCRFNLKVCFLWNKMYTSELECFETFLL